MCAVVDMEGTPLVKGCRVVQPSLDGIEGTVLDVIDSGNVHVKFPGKVPLSICASFFLQVLETPMDVSKDFTPENLRDSYIDGTKEEDQRYPEFPFENRNPLTLLGVSLTGNRVVMRASLRTGDQVLEALGDLKQECHPESIRLIGTWPGMSRTDQFDLNLPHCLKLIIEKM